MSQPKRSRKEAAEAAEGMAKRQRVAATFGKFDLESSEGRRVLEAKSEYADQVGN